MFEKKSKFSSGIRVYHGQRRFLMLTPTYMVDRSSRPYRRLSATLILGCSAPLLLDAGERQPFETRAVLIGPNVVRRRTMGQNCDVAMFDFPVVSSEYRAISSILEHDPIVELDFKRCEALLPRLSDASRNTVDSTTINSLFADAIEALSGHSPVANQIDPRITKALRLIDKLEFDQVGLESLGQSLHLSKSRLSHLFKQETGFSIAQYARWVAVWKTTERWSQGRKLTDVAHEVGFYDQAHLHRAFNEVFGWNPSVAIDPAEVTLIRCE
jgi:AraC-like DNA-binding protein